MTRIPTVLPQTKVSTPDRLPQTVCPGRCLVRGSCLDSRTDAAKARYAAKMEVHSHLIKGVRETVPYHCVTRLVK